ncbi:hypothetical protein RCC89_17935 [Cytophagaceae bacterium ABcell3]|nr:hypothetical protein RCC89_17935 [Cytophagaceae bacterium ABcell3]
MDKKATIERLNQLEQKVRILLRDYNNLKGALKSAVEENKLLKNEVESLNEQVRNFNNQDKISKIVSSVKDDPQKTTELKNTLNEYIKEIDKCIAHLSE